MTRNVSTLAGRPVDVLVIGAGIYGATLAWDAAQRGLSVAVIDRGDFGAATTFNSLKTVHGGLRSLQRAAFVDMREFIRERRALCRIAPHVVHPLPFVIPTYRHPMRSRPLMRAVLAVNDLVAFDRNALADPSKHLPGGRTISRDECLALNPAIDPAGVTGGAIWYDCQMYSADRLNLSFLLSAARAGALATNYVEATDFLMDRGRVIGVRAVDRLAGQPLEIRARLTVNAAGPWVWSLLALVGAASVQRPHGFAKAINLVTRPVTTGHGLGGLANGRFLFIAPWRDCSILGTSQDPHAGSADDVAVSAGDVDALLADARRAFPRAGLTRADVRLVHRGLLPAAPGPGGHERLIKNSLILDHRRDGVHGLLSVLGVRYTTARATAARAADRVQQMLDLAPTPCRTDVVPLAGGDIDRFPDYEREVLSAHGARHPEGRLRRLIRCHGTGHTALLDLIAKEPALGTPLSPACDVTRAEIAHAARHEMAVHLSDALIRRTDAGPGGHPGDDAVRTAAEVMAAELGWDDQTVREEVDAVNRFYRIPA